MHKVCYRLLRTSQTPDELEANLTHTFATQVIYTALVDPLLGTNNALHFTSNRLVPLMDHLLMYHLPGVMCVSDLYVCS